MIVYGDSGRSRLWMADRSEARDGNGNEALPDETDGRNGVSAGKACSNNSRA